MIDFDDDTLEIDLQELVNAYAYGVFPMADSHDGQTISWIEPRERGIMPLYNGFKVRRSLRKEIKKTTLEIRVNTNFKSVMQHCAVIYENHISQKNSHNADHFTSNRETNRNETWINPIILKSYCNLHRRGLAHSVECYNENNQLVGGLYGLMLGQAFFGESMFSLESFASQIALVNLVSRLRIANFKLLDCQFVNDHLSQFGIKSMDQKDYVKNILSEAIYSQAKINPFQLSNISIQKEHQKVLYNL